jgi:hypothetical protein
MDETFTLGRKLANWLFTPWVVIGSLLLAMIFSCATLSFLWFTRPGSLAQPPATAVLDVIVAPTFTPLPLPTAPAWTPTAVITSSVPPPPAPGTIALGNYVQIKGTGGDGLRLRSKAGLKGDVLILGTEAEVFLVKDGPTDSDGFTWWYLVGPYDSSRQGWGVANYLSVVQNP